MASGNQLHKVRRTGLTVRFEMPFAVWCAGCPRPTLIAQGERFNATKRRAGSYHSTPVWAFRMLHASCGGALEIRTDPANTAYVVTEGGRARDARRRAHGGRVAGGAGGVPDAGRAHGRARGRLRPAGAHHRPPRPARRRRRAHRRARERQPPRLGRPLRAQPRAAPRLRVARKAGEAAAAADDGLRDRMGLAIDLVPASADDARRAAWSTSAPDDAGRPVDKVLAQPLFADDDRARGTTKKNSRKMLKSELAAARTREALASEIVVNTRLARDPFWMTASPPRETETRPACSSPALKRKKTTQRRPAPEPPPNDGDTDKERRAPAAKPAAAISLLVTYDSD